MLRLNDLISGFRRLGLEKNDVILVHSSFKSFGEVEGGPKTIIDALTSILDEEGTLIVPTFNFDFCQGKSFDVRNTPSKMGVITELVRQNPKSRRTIDPVYSFCILGKLSETLKNLKYENSYGKDSMFHKLRELNGKIMIMGLRYNDCMTFFHHVEEMEGCDYRYHKEFRGLITDWDGNIEEGKIVLYVRDLEKGVITKVEKMGEILERDGLVNVTKIGNSTVKLMNANDVYIRTTQEMKKNPHILCEIQINDHSR